MQVSEEMVEAGVAELRRGGNIPQGVVRAIYLAMREAEPPMKITRAKPVVLEDDTAAMRPTIPDAMEICDVCNGAGGDNQHTVCGKCGGTGGYRPTIPDDGLIEQLQSAKQWSCIFEHEGQMRLGKSDAPFKAANRLLAMKEALEVARALIRVGGCTHAEMTKAREIIDAAL